MKSIPNTFLWLPCLLAFALPAGAQPADSPLPPAFGEIIDVRVINLEVVVTDGKDRVRGLASEDFRLLVDGREMPIEYFTEVEGGRAVSPEAHSDGTIPALAPGEAVGTRFLVFIDDVFAIKNQRNRVLRKLVEQLPAMGPDDHMAVVAFDGREIELLTSWTSSQGELERVFADAQRRRSYGLQHSLPQYGVWGSTRGPFLGVSFDPAFADRSLYGYDRWPPAYFAFGAPRGSLAYSDVGRVLNAATSTLRGFAKPPGRKVMLLLSGGWPVGAGGSFSTAVRYEGGGATHSLLRPLVDTANRLGYTLYPVDIKGLEHYFGGAQFGTLGQATFAADLHRGREWIEESSMVFLAEETGGRALLDGASTKALERAVEDTRSYYWLGFTPTWQENDRRHRVKVQVQQKGLRVRSRGSFSDLSRQTEVAMLMESTQLFDLPIPGARPDLAVSFGEPEKGGYRKVILPLRLVIPLDDVTLFPHEGGFAGRLELRVAATDDRGSTAAIPVIPIELREETVHAGAKAVFELSMKLRRRPHQFLISLHDPASGNLMSKRVAWTL